MCRTIVTSRKEIRVTNDGGLLLYMWPPQSLSIYISFHLYAGTYFINCNQNNLGKLEAWSYPASRPAVFWTAFLDSTLEKDGFWAAVHYIDGFWTAYYCTKYIHYLLMFPISWIIYIDSASVSSTHT